MPAVGGKKIPAVTHATFLAKAEKLREERQYCQPLTLSLSATGKKVPFLSIETSQTASAPSTNISDKCGSSEEHRS